MLLVIIDLNHLKQATIIMADNTKKNAAVITKNPCSLIPLATSVASFIPTYQEGDDIKTYEGVKAMYTPADFDASTVREITPEEHLSYHAAKEQALQE